MLKRIRELLKPPVIENEEEALAGSLLYTILIIFAIAGFVVPLLLNIVALLDPNDEIPFELSTLLMGLIVPALGLGLLHWLHKGRIRLASVIMTSVLFLLTTSTIITFRGTRDTASGMYILVIAMAGLLLGGQAAIIFMVLSLLATLGVYFAEVNGLLTISLSATPEIIEWIIFAIVVFLIGILLRFAFETLRRALRQAREANEELEEIQESLADRVAARTRDLELAAEIGRYISGVRESEEILLEAVEVIRSRFDLYYTQIYLLDEERNNLVLRAGTGVVGQQLRQLGHRLPISSTSINGTAVFNKESVIVADTAESSIFRKNPLLPDTRSEMAVPLIVSGNVIGSLNLQSSQPNALTAENSPAFEALAGQLAVALENARLFTETAEVQDTLESLARRLTRSGWESYLNAIDRQETIAYTYDLNRAEFTQTPIEPDEKPSFSVPINLGGEVLGKIEIQGNEWSTWQKEQKDLVGAVAQRVAQQIENLRLLSETERYRSEAEEANRRLTKEGWESFVARQSDQPEGYLYDQQEVSPLSGGNGHQNETELVKSLTVRGEPIGQIEIEGISDSDEEASELIEAVAERLSAHIENLRLSTQTEMALTETERRAEELAVINELAKTVSQQLNLLNILETAYQQVGRVLSADAFFVGLYDQTTNLINYPLIYDEGERFEEGTHYLEKDTSIYKVLKTGESTIVGYESEEDLPTGEVLEKNAMGNESKASRSMLFVPLIFSNYAVGVMSVQSYQFNAYNETDMALVEGIASHLAVAIQNAQLFEQTQSALAETEEQASRLALLTELGQALTQAETLEEVYEVTAERAHKIVDSDRASIALISEDGNHYDILALGGEKGSTRVGQNEPLEGSSVGLAVKENRLVVVNKSEDSGITGIFAFMVAPLIASGRVIGTLNIGSKTTNTFGPREERLVLQIASLLATTIESRRLLAQTQQRAEELAVVNRIARTISEALELSQMLETVLEEISRILPVDAFFVGLYDQEKDLLEYPLVYDDGKRYQIGLDTPSQGSTTREVLQTIEPILTLRTPEEVAKRSTDPTRMVGDISKVSASLMYVPLFLGKRSTGLISIQSYEYNAYKPDDVTLLESIANHVAVALENARLFGETEQRAEELSVVNQVAQVVSQMLELNDLYSAVHEQIQRAIVSDAFYIAIYNREDETINFPYLYDEGERYIIDPIPATSDLEVVQVITTGEPILENYADQETAEQQFSGEVLLATKKAPTSMIFVPLRSGLESVGAISIQNYRSHRYTQADVDLLSGIAYHLAVALENARLFSETEQRAEELAVINKIAQAVSGQIEQQELLTTVYDQIRRVMPVDAFTVTAFNAETEMLHYLMVMDEGKQFEQKPTALGIGAVSRVIKEGQPILINRTQEELDELAQKQGVILIGNVQRFSASLIFVPLQIGTETIGGLSVQSYELNAYSQPEIELLVGVANHVAVALENVRLFEETQNTLAETELLYNMGTHINRAATLQDLASVVGVSGIAPGAQSAGLFRFELDEAGQPEWMELEASWIGVGESVLPIGSRLHMPEIPLTAAELYTPNEPLLIENIATDDRVDTSAKAMLRGLNTNAVAIIPMQQLDTWIGTLIIRWGEPYPFGVREQRLYNSLARQMSTALSNQLLLTETQDRATQLEKLTQIETALSQADDEEGIVESLALLAGDSQMLSLHYIVEEDKPKTAFTAARWVSDGNNRDEVSLYEPFDIGLHAGFNLGLKNPDKISYVSDIKSDERITVKEAEKTDYRAIMVIPLRSVGRWLGFVTVTWSEAHKFSAAEVAVWEQLRESLAANVASRRAYLAQQEALSETAVLYETGAQLSTASSYDEILTVIRKNTVLGQGITNVSIMLFEHEWRQGKTPAYMDVLTFWSRADLEQTKLRFHIDQYPSARGILEKASLSPLVFADVPNSTEIDEKMKLMLVNGFKTKTFVVFALSIRGEWIGIVAANYAQETKLSQREIRRIEAIIQQAGIAVQGLRNLEQAEQQAREARNRSNELVILNEMGRSLTALVDMDSILENVYRYTARLMDANNFYIAFFDMKRNEISFALDIRGDRVIRNAGTRKAGKGLTEHIINTKEPLLITENVDGKVDELGIEKIGPSAASWLGVPLMVGSQVIGVIGLQQWEIPRTYNKQHLHLLTSVAAQAAIAIENARLFEQIQARARRERILREVTARVRGAADADSVMRTAVQEIGRALGRRTFVYLNQDQPQELESTKEEAYGD